MEQKQYGNGTDGKKDVYKLEKNSDSADIEVLYYNGEGESLAIGTLTDLGPGEPNIITFYLSSFSVDGASFPFHAEEGMTFGQWCRSKYFEDPLLPNRGIEDRGDMVYVWGDRLYGWLDWDEVIVDGEAYEWERGRQE